MTTEQTRHPRLQMLFTLLSLADFALTWMLLDGGEGPAYEANPVARWWLDRHGWAGLACFKAGNVAVVLALTFVVSRTRPRIAGRVLFLGCACLATVAAYSTALYGAAVWRGETAWQERHELARFNDETRANRNRLAPFRALLLQVSAATREGRYTLLEAVELLEATQTAQDPASLLELTPLEQDGPPARRLAVMIAGNILGTIREQEECERTFYRLDEEFRSAFGMALPRPARTLRGSRQVGQDARPGREYVIYRRIRCEVHPGVEIEGSRFAGRWVLSRAASSGPSLPGS